MTKAPTGDEIIAELGEGWKQLPVKHRSSFLCVAKQIYQDAGGVTSKTQNVVEGALWRFLGNISLEDIEGEQYKCDRIEQELATERAFWSDIRLGVTLAEESLQE